MYTHISTPPQTIRGSVLGTMVRILELRVSGYRFKPDNCTTENVNALLIRHLRPTIIHPSKNIQKIPMTKGVDPLCDRISAAICDRSVAQWIQGLRCWSTNHISSLSLLFIHWRKRVWVGMPHPNHHVSFITFWSKQIASWKNSYYR